MPQTKARHVPLNEAAGREHAPVAQQSELDAELRKRAAFDHGQRVDIAEVGSAPRRTGLTIPACTPANSPARGGTSRSPSPRLSLYPRLRVSIIAMGPVT